MSRTIALGLAGLAIALSSTQASAGGWRDDYGYYPPAPVYGYGYYSPPSVYYAPPPVYRYEERRIYYYGPRRVYRHYRDYDYRPRYYDSYYGYPGWRRW
jgi:hypothetical protein